jgi:hypothetical protein
MIPTSQLTVRLRCKGIILRALPACCHDGVEVWAQHVDIDLKLLWWTAYVEYSVPDREMLEFFAATVESHAFLPSVSMASHVKDIRVILAMRILPFAYKAIALYFAACLREASFHTSKDFVHV